MFMESAIRSLARSRPVFDLERNFQDALCQEILMSNTGYEVQAEYNHPVLDRKRIDLWIKDQQNHHYAVELKYVTCAWNGNIGGKSYRLKDQDAYDQRRYDFLKDVVRLETIAKSCDNTTGYAIMLTNVDGMWKESTRKDVGDVEFKIHEGRRIHGSMQWFHTAGPGTTKGREGPIVLGGEYVVKWEDYSNQDGGASRFRYLMLKIKPQSSS